MKKEGLSCAVRVLRLGERETKTKYIGRDATLGATQVCVCVLFFLLQCMDGIAAPPHTTRNWQTDGMEGRRRNEGCEMKEES